MAMNPLHRIRRSKRQLSGEHLVQSDAERVEIAARIDRTIHATGLLRRHVGECSRDELWRLVCLALARKTRGNAKASQPHLAGINFEEDGGRLDVFVNQAAAVKTTERDR